MNNLGMGIFRFPAF